MGLSLGESSMSLPRSHVTVQLSMSFQTERKLFKANTFCVVSVTSSFIIDVVGTESMRLACTNVTMLTD